MRHCVYFIQAGPRGPIKIGVSIHVEKRLLELRRQHRNLVLRDYFEQQIGVRAGHPDYAWLRDFYAKRDDSLLEMRDLVLTRAIPDVYESVEQSLHLLFDSTRLTCSETAALHLPHYEWFQATRALAWLADAQLGNPWVPPLRLEKPWRSAAIPIYPEPLTTTTTRRVHADDQVEGQADG